MRCVIQFFRIVNLTKCDGIGCNGTCPLCIHVEMNKFEKCISIVSTASILRAKTHCQYNKECNSFRFIICMCFQNECK